MCLSDQDRLKYEKLCLPGQTCSPEDKTEMLKNIDKIFEEYKEIILKCTDKDIGTWLMERDIAIKVAKNALPPDAEKLSRGRIVLVNPGVSSIGREQRGTHYYIILGEHQQSLIGVPITNMAFNEETGKYYIRHFFEVELKEPNREKIFNEYRCAKPSVADIRNIAGLDKRRIIKNQLFHERKFAPQEYLNAISSKMRVSIAMMP